MIAETWLATVAQGDILEIAKETRTTRAWFATIDGADVFVKWYPTSLTNTWAEVERSIASKNLHPSIVPLRRVVHCCDGDLFVYDRISGGNLVQQPTKKRFPSLPVAERTNAILNVCDALAAVCEAGFVVVDWYEGNMLYDFDSRRIWLYDWELSRTGNSFVLEMDSNYGSSRLMAPEEFVRGSSIDQTSLVFNIGRFALLNLPELADQLAEVIAQATYPARSGRFQTVRQLAGSLRQELRFGERHI